LATSQYPAYRLKSSRLCCAFPGLWHRGRHFICMG